MNRKRDWKERGERKREMHSLQREKYTERDRQIETHAGTYLMMKKSDLCFSPCVMMGVSKAKFSRRKLSSRRRLYLGDICLNKGWCSTNVCVARNSFTCCSYTGKLKDRLQSPPTSPFPSSFQVIQLAWGFTSFVCVDAFFLLEFFQWRNQNEVKS